MKEVYESSTFIVPSLADRNGLLSIPGVFRLFQDMAAVHAQQLGAGYYHLLEKDLFWLTVKTKIQIRKMPGMAENVILRTWPELPGKLRCNRSYELDWNGETVISGKTEWAVMNFKTKRLGSPAEVFPADLDYRPVTACPAPFARIPEQFEGIEPYAEYRVRSADIDIGHHMNNVAYVQALAGSLSCDEWEKLPKNSVDVLFRSSCYEGDLLQFRRKDTDNGVQICVSREDDTVLMVNME